MHSQLQRRFQVGAIVLAQDRQADPASGQVQALVTFQEAALKHPATDLFSGDRFYPQGDQAIIDEDYSSRGQFMGQFGIGYRDSLRFTGIRGSGQN